MIIYAPQDGLLAVPLWALGAVLIVAMSMLMMVPPQNGSGKPDKISVIAQMDQMDHWGTRSPVALPA
jgi:hypothetical protein